MSEVLASAEEIKSASERLSASAALGRLEIWRTAQPGVVVPVKPTTFESPSRLFRVKFEADFGLQHGDHTIAIHLWNTMRPPLALGPTYAAMALVAASYGTAEGAPDDIGVLSTRDPTRLYRLSEVADPSALVASIVERLEETIRGTRLPPAAPEPRPPL